MIIDVSPEFGYELACSIPYAYYLQQKNKLEKVITCKGMKPFYFFCENVEERYTTRNIDNGSNGVQNLPNKWIHHNSSILNKEPGQSLTPEEQIFINGQLDYSEWISPSYSEYYKNNEYTLDNPFVVISNKLTMDHGEKPRAYFDIQTLYEIFNYFKDKNYDVVYKRPKTEFPIDINEATTIYHKYDIVSNVEGIGVIDDFELTEYYDNVHLLSSFYKSQEPAHINEVQLKLFSNAEGFMSIAGGNAMLCSLFGKPNIIYITTSGELREGYFDENSYYRKLSGAELYPIRDSEEDIVKRGHNNYKELLKTMKEVL
jgi:hypothetical protein